MRTIWTAAAITLAVTAFAPLSAQQPTERRLQVSFDQQGNVTVIAQNVTIPEILAEWGRQGGTIMVNASRLGGGPVSRFYTSRPETEVIESLLRQAAGYIVTPRREGVMGASRFEVVQITPTSVTTGSYTSVPNSAVSAPVTTTRGAPDDELPPIAPPGTVNPPTTVNQQPTPPPSGYPASSGVSVPVVPVIAVPSGGRGTPPPPAPGTTGRGGGGGTR